jgi:hypothetical protein
MKRGERREYQVAHPNSEKTAVAAIFPDSSNVYYLLMDSNGQPLTAGPIMICSISASLIL